MCVIYFCLHHSGTHNSTAPPIKNIFGGNHTLVSSELMLGDLVVLVTLYTLLIIPDWSDEYYIDTYSHLFFLLHLE